MQTKQEQKAAHEYRMTQTEFDDIHYHALQELTPDQKLQYLYAEERVKRIIAERDRIEQNYRRQGFEVTDNDNI